MQCEDCNGTGKNSKGNDCFICDGTGSRCDECGEACDAGAYLCDECQADADEESNE